jgi:hypothetical protein
MASFVACRIATDLLSKGGIVDEGKIAGLSMENLKKHVAAVGCCGKWEQIGSADGEAAQASPKGRHGTSSAK